MAIASKHISLHAITQVLSYSNFKFKLKKNIFKNVAHVDFACTQYREFVLDLLFA